MRFEIAVNGVVVATAGQEDFGQLLATLVWNKIDPSKWPADVREATLRAYRSSEVLLQVRAFDGPSDHFLEWKMPQVVVGDTVTIRVLGPGENTEPDERYANPKR